MVNVSLYRSLTFSWRQGRKDKQSEMGEENDEAQTIQASRKLQREEGQGNQALPRQHNQPAHAPGMVPLPSVG